MSNRLLPSDVMIVVNRYIGGSGGYLGDFTYRTHREFYTEYCGLSISPDELLGTTRDRFIEILGRESASVQAKILRGVVERFPVDASDAPSTRTNVLRTRVLDLASTLESLPAVLSPSPAATSEVLRRATADAEALLKTADATNALDRVHTALHGHLLALCNSAGFTYPTDPTATQLYKILRQQHPKFANVGPRASDIDQVVRTLANVLDTLQPIRNRASLAHPNTELLPPPEATLVINAARAIGQYLDDRLGDGERPVNSRAHR